MYATKTRCRLISVFFFLITPFVKETGDVRTQTNTCSFVRERSQHLLICQGEESGDTPEVKVNFVLYEKGGEKGRMGTRLQD